jgi:hypothetical protein
MLCRFIRSQFEGLSIILNQYRFIWNNRDFNLGSWGDEDELERKDDEDS